MKVILVEFCKPASMKTKLILNVCGINFEDSGAYNIGVNVKFPANVTSTEPALWGGLQTASLYTMSTKYFDPCTRSCGGTTDTT